ncbi:hypothetical protein FACS1894120_3950 [Clostridia bacterium]|nr:hypothetical protein FACS1894120_3950 [Clostridia bacterium]
MMGICDKKAIINIATLTSKIKEIINEFEFSEVVFTGVLSFDDFVNQIVFDCICISYRQALYSSEKITASKYWSENEADRKDLSTLNKFLKDKINAARSDSDRAKLRKNNRLFWRIMSMDNDIHIFAKSNESGRLGEIDLDPDRFKNLFSIYDKCMLPLQDVGDDESFVKNSIVFYDIERHQSIEAIYSLILEMEKLGLHEITKEAAQLSAGVVLDKNGFTYNWHSCFVNYRKKYISRALNPDCEVSLSEELKTSGYFYKFCTIISGIIFDRYFVILDNVPETADFITNNYDVLSVYNEKKDWTLNRRKLLQQFHNFIFDPNTAPPETKNAPRGKQVKKDKK